MERLILAAAPGTIERPALDDRSLEQSDHGYLVTIFDNEFNTWAEVMMILIVATGCDEEEAYMETWEVHHQGRSVVHHSDKETCETVAQIIRKIGMRVEVTAA